MKVNIKKYKPALKFTTVSILVTIFLHTRTSSCGSSSFGLPLKFIRTTCDCSEHLLPIHFLHLSIDIIYHFTIWSIAIYLWKDTKETWRMLMGKRNIEGL